MADKKITDSLWQSIEELQHVPQAADLKQFSGLLAEDLQRLTAAWENLPVDVRRGTVRAWNALAVEDFEMDFSAVLRMAMRDEDADVRAAAITGLDEDEDIRLIPQLSEILENDTAAVVRAAAARTLAHFVLMGELDKILPRSFEIACMALLKAHNDLSEDLDVRRHALESLAYTSLHGTPRMIEAAYAHPEEKMRISAVLAMGRSADKRWAKIVYRELFSPLPEMRYEATCACGELALPEAIPALIELIEDVNIDIQQTALWALGQIGGKLAQRALEKYVTSDNLALRQAAHNALEELEFFHGDLTTFFGPPTEFDGAGEVSWAEEDAHEGISFGKKLALGFGENEDDFDDEDEDLGDEDLGDEGLEDEDFDDEDDLLTLYLEDEDDDVEDPWA
ncbi:MAG: HEAT repeat domain-containing protein [Anaerolineae bacterium]|nr:HEAT repeat domain-containing protein [Anaerolineae bacterium]